MRAKQFVVGAGAIFFLAIIAVIGGTNPPPPAPDPDPIESCTTASYFFKKDGKWYLNVVEHDTVMELSTDTSGPGYTIDDKLTAMLRIELIDQYTVYFKDLYERRKRIPFNWVAQIKGECSVTPTVRPYYNLMKAVAALDTADICDSKLYLSKNNDAGEWMLSCKGCSAIHLDDIMSIEETARMMIAAEILSQKSNKMQIVSLWRLVPRCKEG